jgi:hypothetical protein
VELVGILVAFMAVEMMDGILLVALVEGVVLLLGHLLQVPEMVLFLLDHLLRVWVEAKMYSGTQNGPH